MPERVKVGVYAEVDPNLIDGSSVWLQSICLTLAAVPGADVTLLLRTPMARDLLLRPLLDERRVEVVEPPGIEPGGRLTAAGAVEALARLDACSRFDLLVLRGAAVADSVAADGRFDGRVWLYHVPTAETTAARLRAQGAGAHRVLCQTEEIRELITASAPELASRTLILPPMIPPPGATPARPDGPIRRLFYAGKLSPEYMALEMVELLRRLRRELPGLELHIAGDKIHNPPGDPGFRPAMRRALEETDGLVWHGAVDREEVARLLGGADVALSLRHPSLDASAEMSTKVLEYGAAGCPVLLNPTALHKRLLGEDYPLLAADLDAAQSALTAASRDPLRRRRAGHRVEELSRGHGFDRVAERLTPHLAQAGTPAPAAARRPDRVLLAGHSFGFAEGIAARLEASGIDLRRERWASHSEHDEEQSEAALAWADVILCEWCLGNAVWYSRHRAPGQRLVVRFHRMELETPYPGQLDLERVDAVVFVADHVRRAACERFDWSPEDPRLIIVPNAIEPADLGLEKLPGAEFTLAAIGYVPRIKRLDRTLEILERLRAHDDRYRLLVKGRGPWEYPWMAARDGERAYYQELFERIERSPLLRQAVVFEPFGDDVAAFLRQADWIVSASEVEGHSVALAEGMSSGAIPVVLERPGAAGQYEAGWVHADPEAAADSILAIAASGATATEAERVKAFARRWGWNEVGPTWDRLLDRAGADRDAYGTVSTIRSRGARL